MPTKKKVAATLANPPEPFLRPEPVAKPKSVPVPFYKWEEDEDAEGSPAYLQKVGREAWERNHLAERPDSPKLLRWLVTYGNLAATVSAPNKPDAWAQACDQWRQWPSPRLPGIDIQQV